MIIQVIYILTKKISDEHDVFEDEDEEVEIDLDEINKAISHTIKKYFK